MSKHSIATISRSSTRIPRLARRRRMHCPPTRAPSTLGHRRPFSALTTRALMTSPLMTTGQYHMYMYIPAFPISFSTRRRRKRNFYLRACRLRRGSWTLQSAPKADAHCLPSGSVGGESIVRRRLNKKTKPADAYSQAGPAMEPASCDSPAAQEGLVTREAAAATRRKFREEATAHERKARATRTEAWKAAFHEPAAVHLHADHVQTEFIADECVQWAVHASHTVRKSPGAEILFCEACGAWSRGLKTRGLAVACRKTSAHRGNIRLLQLGIAPVKGARVPNALKKAGSRGTRGGSAAKSGKRRAKRRA